MQIKIVGKLCKLLGEIGVIINTTHFEPVNVDSLEKVFTSMSEESFLRLIMGFNTFMNILNLIIVIKRRS